VKPTPVYMRHCQMLLSIHVKILQRKWLCWKCVARILGFLFFFTFRPIASKQLNSLTTIDTFSRLGDRGNASKWGARGPVFDSWLWQGFLYLILCFVVVVFLHFLSKPHYWSHHFAISFAMCIRLVFNMLRNLWPLIRVPRYSIFNTQILRRHVHVTSS